MRFSNRLLIYIILILLVCAIGLSWFLLTSEKIANSLSIIKLRQNYYSVLLPKLGVSLKSMPFEIMPLTKIQGEEGYLYTMLGKFVRIDLNNQIAFVQTSSDTVYGFIYPIYPPNHLKYQQKINGEFIDQSGVGA